MSHFENPTSLTVGDLTVYPAERSARFARRRIDLSRRELTLLRILMSMPNRIFTREELCRQVWRRKYSRTTKLVEVSIARLRRKIGEPDLIQTVRSEGYTLREQA